MEIKTNLCSNEVRKVALLITKASELGMDIGGYGYAAANTNTGVVYLWLEDYPFHLYIDLGDDTIYAGWTNYDNGDEHWCMIGGMSLNDLYAWCDELEKQTQEVTQ
jgi:hypothetical protein